MGMYQYKEVPKSFERFWAAEEMAEIEGRSLLKRFCSDKLKKERLRGITSPAEFDIKSPNSSVLRSINAALLKQTVKSRPYLECVNTPMNTPDVKFIDVKKATLTVCLISPPMRMTKDWMTRICNNTGSSIETSGDQSHIYGRYFKASMLTVDSESFVKARDPKAQWQCPYLPKWAVKTYRYVRMLNRLAILNAVPVNLTTSTSVIFDEDYLPIADRVIEGSIVRLQINVVVHLYHNMISLEKVREINPAYARTPRIVSLMQMKELLGDKWASPRYWLSARDFNPRNTEHAWEEEEYKRYFMSERALLFIPQLRVIFNTLARLTSYGPSVFEVGTGKCSVQISDSEDDESPALSSEA